MELCILCLDGLEPSLVSDRLTNLVLPHRGVCIPPCASSLIAWKRFAHNRKHGTWWSDWRETIVLDLPVHSTHATDNFSATSKGGLLFDGYPNDQAVREALAATLADVTAQAAHLAAAVEALPPAEVLIAYLSASDTIGHVCRNWKQECLHVAYRAFDALAGRIWETCRPRKRLVLSDHGMAPITRGHVGWGPYNALGEEAFVKRTRSGSVCLQTGQHWGIRPGYISSNFLSGDCTLHNLGGRIRRHL